MIMRKGPESLSPRAWTQSTAVKPGWFGTFDSPAIFTVATLQIMILQELQGLSSAGSKYIDFNVEFRKFSGSNTPNPHSGQRLHFSLHITLNSSLTLWPISSLLGPKLGLSQILGLCRWGEWCWADSINSSDSNVVVTCKTNLFQPSSTSVWNNLRPISATG